MERLIIFFSKNKIIATPINKIEFNRKNDIIYFKKNREIIFKLNLTNKEIFLMKEYYNKTKKDEVIKKNSTTEFEKQITFIILHLLNNKNKASIIKVDDKKITFIIKNVLF